MTGGLVQMIQLIGTEELTLAFFKAYAPHLEVDDIEPGLTPIRRANLLFKKMEQFLEQYPGEHSAVFRALNVIAAVNTDGANLTAIMDFIATNHTLKKIYYALETARLFNGHNTLSSLAAFVAYQAQAGKGEAKNQAQELWGALQAQTTQVVQGKYLRKDITEPTHDAAGRAAGILKFQDELSKHICKINQRKKFLAIVIPNRTAEGYTRYYVNISPPDRVVLQDKGDKAEMDVDHNMTGFEIRHYYVSDRIWISEIDGADQETILNMFLNYVLGSSTVKRRRLHFEHRLPLFRYPEMFEKQITLPSTDTGHGEKVYISEMEIILCEDYRNLELTAEPYPELMPDVFRGDEFHAVHSQIAKKLADKFPRELWTIKRAEVTAKIHPNVPSKTGKGLVRSDEFVEVKFPIRPHGCTPKIPPKYKFDKDLRRRALALRDRWHFDGITEAEFAKLSDEQKNGGL